MAENKTKVTDVSAESYLSAIEDDSRRTDCETLARLMTKATKEQPKMWGASIVGFGSITISTRAVVKATRLS